MIQKFDPGAMPILQIAVSGNLPLRDLTKIADEQIKERLESVSGVGQVQLVGGADREIQVRLDPDAMRSFNVTLTEVAAALRQQNFELPAGRIPQGSQELTVRTMGKITDPQDVQDHPGRRSRRLRGPPRATSPRSSTARRSSAPHPS